MTSAVSSSPQRGSRQVPWIALLTFAILVVLGGVLLGPLYLVWAAFWSGEEAFSQTIELDEPVRVTLSPEMNPVAFYVAAEYERPRFVRFSSTSTYDAHLSRPESEVWMEHFAISPDTDGDEETWRSGKPIPGRYTTRVRTMEVDEPADYSFVIHETSAAEEIDVERFELRVRRNVQNPSVALGVTGCTMIPLGVLGILLAAFKLLGWRRSSF